MNEFWPEVKDQVDTWVRMFGRKCTPAQVKAIKAFAAWVDDGSPSLYEKRIRIAQQQVQRMQWMIAIAGVAGVTLGLFIGWVLWYF